MSKLIKLLYCCALVYLVLTVYPIKYSCKPKNLSDPIYNYYELAVQKWCGTENSYQIHGLWPQITSGSYPTYCESIPYNPNIPEDILSRMEDEWNDCHNYTIWSHEWKKHGTCFYEQTKLDQMIFFNITVNLFDSIKSTIDDTCGNQTECIVACFDLLYNKVDC